jgi:hypothetical protein
MKSATLIPMKTLAALGMAVFAMSACVADKTDKADTIAAAPSVDTAENPAPAVRAWEVTPTGIGSVKTGMSVDEAQVALHNDLVVPANLAECAFLKTKNGPEGVSFMVEQGHVSRVDVISGPTATSAGARIGDTEDRIKSLYSGISVTPHKYNTGGHYLTYSGDGGKIVFESDGSKVTKYRAGNTPSVENVEGCG